MDHLADGFFFAGCGNSNSPLAPFPLFFDILALFLRTYLRLVLDSKILLIYFVDDVDGVARGEGYMKTDLCIRFAVYTR